MSWRVLPMRLGKAALVKARMGGKEPAGTPPRGSPSCGVTVRQVQRGGSAGFRVWERFD
jgi:hypothetical protein